MTLGRLGVLGLALIAPAGVWIAHAAGWIALVCVVVFCLCGVVAAEVARRWL